ncbi:hypothetical protein OAO87_01335 [bacterium]|nr:hypothetical protein [bacterium]
MPSPCAAAENVYIIRRGVVARWVQIWQRVEMLLLYYVCFHVAIFPLFYAKHCLIRGLHVEARSVLGLHHGSDVARHKGTAARGSELL